MSTQNLYYRCKIIHIAKNWERPKCPSPDEWVNKMWCMYTMEYYMVIKRE